jgi:hypothetical protein
MQRWNGYRPAISWLLRDFRLHLIQEKIDIAFNDIWPKTKRRTFAYPTNHTINNHSISWIDSLLESQIGDFRKYAV